MVYSVEHGGRDGFLDDFYLAPEARGRGLGRQALEALEREAQALGIRVLHLEVEADVKEDFVSRMLGPSKSW